MPIQDTKLCDRLGGDVQVNVSDIDGKPIYVMGCPHYNSTRYECRQGIEKALRNWQNTPGQLWEKPKIKETANLLWAYLWHYAGYHHYCQFTKHLAQEEKKKNQQKK